MGAVVIVVPLEDNIFVVQSEGEVAVRVTTVEVVPELLNVNGISIVPGIVTMLESEEVKVIREENKALKEEILMQSDVHKAEMAEMRAKMNAQIAELKAKTEENSQSINYFEKIEEALKNSGILKNKGLQGNDILKSL